MDPVKSSDELSKPAPAAPPAAPAPAPYHWNRAMDAALDEARAALDSGDVPVGAVVLDADGAIVARGRNMRERHLDPSSHAEVEALRAAARALGRWNLDGCTLVVTLEPCPMCAGAAVSAHVSRIVFGAWDAKMGACGSVWDIPRDPHVGAFPEVYGGVRGEECSRLLRASFRTLRS